MRVRVRAPVAALAGDGGCAGTGMEQHLQAGSASGSPGSWLGDSVGCGVGVSVTPESMESPKGVA